ncbi:MAG: hypothetical protein IJ730_05860 [Alphaproteobacteria bacterium]|nr:hypothetical protein [Alphaproteobacteria bacterium]
MRIIQNILIFLIIQIVFISTDISYATENLRTLHIPVIVMSTDNGYAIQTGASIVSLEKTTPEDKKVIVLSNKLSAMNRQALENLSDPHTRVVVEEIPQKYLEAAEEYRTEWNILSQVRLFYQEIFNELNKNQEFLKKIDLQNTGIHYFIHMDSDTLMIRNLFEIFKSLPSYSCFASTNLNFLSMARLGQEVNFPGANTKGDISGGLIIFFLDNLNACKESVIENAKKCKEENIYLSFYNNDESYQMWKILCDSKNRSEFIKLLNELKTKDPTKLDEVLNARLVLNDKLTGEEKEKLTNDYYSFIRHFITLAEEYVDVISEKMEEIIDFFICESCENKKDRSCVIAAKGKSIDYRLPNPTEEMVFSSYFSTFQLPEKFNFIMKYVFPQIDKTPLEYLAEVTLDFPSIDSFTGIAKELLFRHPELIEEINKNFCEMVMMHFDVCEKPWTPRFATLAKQDIGLQKIIKIYASYVAQLQGFDGLETMKKHFDSVLKKRIKIMTPKDICNLLRSIRPAARLKRKMKNYAGAQFRVREIEESDTKEKNMRH